MEAWVRTVLVLAIFWLFARWFGLGSIGPPDLRAAACWAAMLLGLFLLWRDGRALMARYGLARRDSPLNLLEKRLAEGGIDLRTYRRLRRELSPPEGIEAAKKNRAQKPAWRGDCRE